MNSSDTASALSLALGSRLTIRALLAVQNHAQPDVSLQETVQEVISSLDAINDGGPLFRHLTAESTFTNYDQIQLLAEVSSAFGDQRLPEKLRSIIAADGDVQEREGNIDLAIEFFTALESRAQRRYNEAANSSF